MHMTLCYCMYNKIQNNYLMTDYLSLKIVKFQMKIQKYEMPNQAFVAEH